MKQRHKRRLLRNFVIELIVYGLLVLGYSLFVLRWLGEPLDRLFHNDLIVYALIALGLIVAQGALLDVLTTFLLHRLPLERVE